MSKARTLASTVSTGNVLADGSVAASEVSGLATVATTGSYTDLTNEPTAPTGTIVGTTDSQTLTNKTIVFADNTLTNVASTSTAQTFTGTKTFEGTSSTLAMVLNDAAEVATVSATAATGTIAYDITTQSVLFYTSNASANWTVNFRASSGTSLNTHWQQVSLSRWLFWSHKALQRSSTTQCKWTVQPLA